MTSISNNSPTFIKEDIENSQKSNLQKPSHSIGMGRKKMLSIAGVSVAALLGIAAAGYFAYTKFHKTKESFRIEPDDSRSANCYESIKYHRIIAGKIIPVKGWICLEEGTLDWKTDKEIKAIMNRGKGTFTYMDIKQRTITKV